MAARVTSIDTVRFAAVKEAFDLLAEEMRYSRNLRAVMAQLSPKDIQEIKTLAIRAKQARK